MYIRYITTLLIRGTKHSVKDIQCTVLSLNSLLLFTIILIFFGCSRIDSEFVENATGIILPASINKIDTYDNGEFFVVGHFAIQSNQFQEFIEKYGFTENGKIRLSDLPCLSSLKEKNQKEPMDFKPFYLKGHSKTNSWLFIADKNSNRIWFIIKYPDMGGTPPGPIILRHEKEEQARMLEQKYRMMKSQQN